MASMLLEKLKEIQMKDFFLIAVSPEGRRLKAGILKKEDAKGWYLTDQYLAEISQ